MSPVARLLAAAEVNLADVGRRAVESAVAPVREKLRDLVSETLGRVVAVVRSLAVKAALGVFALVMAIVAVVLALMAAYDALAAVLGPTRALLVMAGAFLLLAVLAAVGIALVPSGTGRRGPGGPVALPATGGTSPRPVPNRRTAEAVPPAGPGSTERALDTGLDALVSALGEAGFKREQAGLRAGLAIARQLRPMQVASLALLGGFVMGARLRFGRR